MQNVPVFRKNIAAASSEINRMKKSAVAAQLLLDEYNTLGLSKISTIEQFKELISGGEVWCKTQLEGLITVADVVGFKMKRSVIVESLELPSFVNLNTLAQQCKQDIYNLKDLSFDGEKIWLSDDEIDRINNKFSILANTAGRLEIYYAAQKMVEGMQAFHQSLLNNKAGGLQVQWDIRTLFSIVGDQVKMNDSFWAETTVLSNA